MEKAKTVVCIPVSFGWNDVGGYNALPEILGIQDDGHTVNTNIMSILILKIILSSLMIQIKK